jgi:hypothetical protein
MTPTWKVEFIVDSSGVWCDSSYRFIVQTDAIQYAKSQSGIRKWRIVEAQGEN